MDRKVPTHFGTQLSSHRFPTPAPAPWCARDYSTRSDGPGSPNSETVPCMVRSSHSSSSTGLSSDLSDWCCFTMPKSASASHCLSFVGTTGPLPTSSFSKSESPFSPSGSRFQAIVYAECVYATPFPTFHEEVIFLGLAVWLDHCDWFAIVQANGHGGRRRLRWARWQERVRTKSRNGVCAACETVWARRRIVDIVGRLRVVGQLTSTSRWRGRAHAVLFNAHWGKA
jgi:hypothetical protein